MAVGVFSFIGLSNPGLIESFQSLAPCCPSIATIARVEEDSSPTSIF